MKKKGVEKEKEEKSVRECMDRGKRATFIVISKDVREKRVSTSPYSWSVKANALR